MKKNVRNALAISGLALAIGASGLTLSASANTSNDRNLRTEKHQSLTKIARIKKTEAIRNITHRRTIPGVVSAVSADAITITKGNKTYSVTISATTRTLNRRWQTIALSDIKTGDKIRVSGTVIGTAITAQTVRDISIPTPIAN
jgi:hypothetical protein